MRSTDRPLTATALLLCSAVLLGGCGGDEPLPGPAEPAVPGEVNPGTGDDGAGGTATAGAGEVVDDGAELSFEDQAGDGTTVTIQQASLSDGTGLVVLTTRGESAPLGVAEVPAGGAQDLTVELDPPLTQSTELLAGLYADTDGNGSYDAGTDAVVLDDDGEAEQEDADYTVE